MFICIVFFLNYFINYIIFFFILEFIGLMYNFVDVKVIFMKIINQFFIILLIYFKLLEFLNVCLCWLYNIEYYIVVFVCFFNLGDSNNSNDIDFNIVFF